MLSFHLKHIAIVEQLTDLVAASATRHPASVVRPAAAAATAVVAGAVVAATAVPPVEVAVAPVIRSAVGGRIVVLFPKFPLFCIFSHSRIPYIFYATVEDITH